MDALIFQTITTELCTNRAQGPPGINSIPWIHFYKMVLSTAKLLDCTGSKQLGRSQGTNRANKNEISTRGNYYSSSNNSSTNSLTPTPKKLNGQVKIWI
jgi:hypothetical protein